MADRSRFKPLTLPIDLSDPEHILCPYHLCRRLHDAGAVGLDPDIGVAVVGYQALVALSKDTGLFSSSITQDGQGPRHMRVSADPIPEDVEEIFTRAHPMVNAVFTADPPVHTRHRKLLSKALSPARVRAMEPRIEARRARPTGDHAVVVLDARQGKLRVDESSYGFGLLDRRWLRS